MDLTVSTSHSSELEMECVDETQQDRHRFRRCGELHPAMHELHRPGMKALWLLAVALSL
jgi:hypothetical protein